MSTKQTFISRIQTNPLTASLTSKINLASCVKENYDCYGPEKLAKPQVL